MNTFVNFVTDRCISRDLLSIIILLPLLLFILVLWSVIKSRQYKNSTLISLTIRAKETILYRSGLFIPLEISSGRYSYIFDFVFEFFVVVELRQVIVERELESIYKREFYIKDKFPIGKVLQLIGVTEQVFSPINVF